MARATPGRLDSLGSLGNIHGDQDVQPSRVITSHLKASSGEVEAPYGSDGSSRLELPSKRLGHAVHLEEPPRCAGPQKKHTKENREYFY